MAAGCDKQQFAAASNRPFQSQESDQKLVLSATDQARVIAAFDQLAASHEPVHPPVAAAGPACVRWSDIPLAVAYACDDAQMAVVQTTKHDWGYEFQLKTIEDYPGQLTIQRLQDARVYEAHATIGRFENHADRAAALLAALDEQMRAFGKKRSLEP